MPAHAVPQQRPSTVDRFVAQTTMRSLLRLDQSHLDQVMATAYVLYQAGRYREVDVLCKGLIAADHTYWWSYSLHAAALRRMGRLTEALQQVDNGLTHEPAEPKLLLMRGEILAAIGAWRERDERGGEHGPVAPTSATVTPSAAAGA
jgi:predicted Zn-dependent protease